MWDIVPVRPGYRGTCLHSQGLRHEGEVIDRDGVRICLRHRWRGLCCSGQHRYHQRGRGCTAERGGDQRAAYFICNGHDKLLQLCSGASMMARRSWFCLNVTLAIPSMVRSLSAGTSFIGPGDAAVPGAGCGNAVERAVWNVTLPSTFCMIWWM